MSTPRAPRRIAHLHVPHGIAALERARRGGDGPLIVHDAGRVLDGCPLAATAGVAPGLPLRGALARCPEAALVAADRTVYLAAWEATLEALSRHSPTVDDGGWGRVDLEAAGLGALYGDEAAWCRALIAAVARQLPAPARIGVAGGRFAARLAAGVAPDPPGYHLVLGDAAAFLADSPLEQLPLEGEARRRLRLLGIRTLGQFARLPATSVAEQFGPASLAAHRLARGVDDRPLVGQRRRFLSVRYLPEDPETRRGALVEALLTHSGDALATLGRRGLAVRRVVLRLQDVAGAWHEGAAWIGGPLGAGRLRGALEGMLARVEALDGGVVEARLLIVGLEVVAGGQLELFAHDAGRIKLHEALGALARRDVGDCILRPVSGVAGAPLVAQRYALERVSL